MEETIPDEVDVKKFQNSLYAIAQKMKTGDGDAFYELVDSLKPFRSKSISAYYGLMSKPVFTVLWLLDRFIFDDLINNFGGDSPGYPIKEGEPRLRSIIVDLGHFIDGAILGPGSSLSRFADALATYGELVYIINQKKIESFDPEEWEKL